MSEQDEDKSELCAWCKNREALHYARYEGCCSLHCRDLMECDQEITKRDKRIKALEGVVEMMTRHLPPIKNCPRICDNCSKVIVQLLKKLEEV